MTTKWEIYLTEDIETNKSDKLFTVPLYAEWQILWISIEYTASSTSGSRLLEIQLQSKEGNVIGQWQAGVNQNENLTYSYLFGTGVPDTKTVPDSNSITTPLLGALFLSGGQIVRVWDNNAIDTAGDDMIVKMQYGGHILIEPEHVVINNCSHLLTSDKIGPKILSINNCLQLLSSNKISTAQQLTINNCSQLQTSNNVTFSYAANDYYVSNTGSDSNPGTLSQPWRTISYGVGQIHGGDALNIRGGTYNERVTLTNSGTAGNYIVIQSYEGETAIIDGTAIIFNSGGLINVSNKNYIKLNNLTVRYADSNGIYFNTCNYIEINNCTTFDVNDASGIGVWWSDNVKVYNNKVINSHISSIPDGGHEESISIAGTTNFEISYNEVYRDVEHPAQFGDLGIDCKQGSRFGTVHHNYVHDYDSDGGTGGIYIDAWDRLTGDIDVYNNYINNSAVGIDISSERGGTCENVRVYNNIIYNTNANGIHLQKRPPPYDYGIRRNIEIYNNTIHKVKYNGGAGIYITAYNISNIVIRNNIVYMNGYNGEIVAGDISLLDYISCDHNLVYGPKYCSQEYPDCIELSDNPTGYPNIYGNITANPMFTSTLLPDFHLLDGSPAINTGVGISLVSKDYDSVARPQGTAYDIGAFEHIMTYVDYYVDATSGNDGNDGLSTAKAWKTMDKVNAFPFIPGDRILFKRGEEWYHQITPTRNGNAGNPIVYGAYGTGNRPIIHGNVVHMCALFVGESYHHLRFESIDFAGSNATNYAAAFISGHDVYMFDCIFRDSQYMGFVAWTESGATLYNITVDSCEAYNNHDSGICITSNTATGGPHDCEVKYCISHNNGNALVYYRDHGIYVRYGCIVHDCVSYNQEWGAGIKVNNEGIHTSWYPTVYNNTCYDNFIGIYAVNEYATIYNNLVYNNIIGVVMDPDSNHMTFMFNTIVNSTSNSEACVFQINNTGSNNTIKNNLIIQDRAISPYWVHRSSYVDTADFALNNSIDYNTYYTNGISSTDIFRDSTGNRNWTEWKALTGSPDAHSTFLTSLPDVVSRYTNMHPTDGGNIKNKGVTISGYNTDKDNNDREVPPTPGCYEEATA